MLTQPQQDDPPGGLGAWLLVLALPPLTFFAMVFAVREPTPPAPRAPRVEAGCGAPRIALPAGCTQPEPLPCLGCTLWTCEVGPDWVLPIALSALDPACEYTLLVTDRGVHSPDVASWLGVASPVACRRAGDQASCPLEPPPLRLMHLTLVAATPAGRLVAAAPGHSFVVRDGALDIRPSAWVPTLGIIVVATGMASILLVFAGWRRRRPHGKHPDRLRAMLAACGAALSVLLMVSLPVDVGGFDVFAPERFLWLGPLAALVAAPSGPALAALRSAYQTRTFAARALLLGGALLGAIAASLLFQRTSSEDVLFYEAVGHKDRFYCALAVALLLPAIVLPGARARPGRLVAGALASAALLAAVAIATLEALGQETHPYLHGFYKPMSAFVLPLTLLPWLGAVAVAATLAAAYPTWLVRATALLRTCLDEPRLAERMRAARALALHLVRHGDVLALCRGPECAPLTRLAPLVIAPLAADPHERERLSQRLPDAGRRLDELVATLMALRAKDGVREETSRAPAGRKRWAAFLPWHDALSPTYPVVVTLVAGALDDDLARRDRAHQLVGGLGGLEPGFLLVHVDDLLESAAEGRVAP